MWLHMQVTHQKTGLQKLHAELKEATPSSPITEQDLIWALQAVRSRAFSGPYAGVLLTFPAHGILHAISQLDT